MDGGIAFCLPLFTSATSSPHQSLITGGVFQNQDGIGNRKALFINTNISFEALNKSKINLLCPTVPLFQYSLFVQHKLNTNLCRVGAKPIRARTKLHTWPSVCTKAGGSTSKVASLTKAQRNTKSSRDRQEIEGLRGKDREGGRCRKKIRLKEQ